MAHADAVHARVSRFHATWCRLHATSSKASLIQMLKQLLHLKPHLRRPVPVLQKPSAHAVDLATEALAFFQSWQCQMTTGRYQQRTNKLSARTSMGASALFQRQSRCLWWQHVTKNAGQWSV